MVTRTPSPGSCCLSLSLSLLASIMAPAADRPGYWGRPTSTLDWCEENYSVSFYIAEFWNTVSNLIMILPPVYGAIQTLRDGLETRYVFAYVGLAAVGIGSWCFHMTLQYEMQLLDELPMIYSCCVFVYCLYECSKQKTGLNYFLIFILLAFSVSVTTVYLQWKEPIFHQGCQAKDASCYRRCHSVSCLVAHSDGPRLLPTHPVQPAYEIALPQAQTESKVHLWGVASDLCGASEEPLRKRSVVETPLDSSSLPAL
ncbi:alkaline ceramidase 3 isoform X4 [Polyodon spathula]|uniref:alkaline ceramidase 3 isoform X4 n=1 Tax=Polyodon spathula TaxID=7913 RepID=UPI001B7E6BFA|nr:alkaline ceramidase 3 isoform X4 [Polyodon spathula]